MKGAFAEKFSAHSPGIREISRKLRIGQKRPVPGAERQGWTDGAEGYQRRTVSEHFRKMTKRKKDPQKPKKALDRYGEKSRRGRRGIRPSEVFNRAEHYYALLQNWWHVLGEAFLRVDEDAEVEAEVKVEARVEVEVELVRAFDQLDTNAREEFLPRLVPLIPKIRRELKFPKTQDAQIRFFADSLAARGNVSPRRSRDICSEKRARQKAAHHIIRQEFYVECTCGYKGPALNGACRKCHAQPALWQMPEILKDVDYRPARRRRRRRDDTLRT